MQSLFSHFLFCLARLAPGACAPSRSLPRLLPRLLPNPLPNSPPPAKLHELLMPTALPCGVEGCNPSPASVRGSTVKAP